MCPESDMLPGPALRLAVSIPCLPGKMDRYIHASESSIRRRHDDAGTQWTMVRFERAVSHSNRALQDPVRNAVEHLQVVSNAAQPSDLCPYSTTCAGFPSASHVRNVRNATSKATFSALIVQYKIWWSGREAQWHRPAAGTPTR